MMHFVNGNAVAAVARFRAALNARDSLQKLWKLSGSDSTGGRGNRMRALAEEAGIRPALKRRWRAGGPITSGGYRSMDWSELNYG